MQLLQKQTQKEEEEEEEEEEEGTGYFPHKGFYCRLNLHMYRLALRYCKVWLHVIIIY